MSFFIVIGKVIIFISHFVELSFYYYNLQHNFLVRTNLTVYKIIFFQSFLGRSIYVSFYAFKNSNFWCDYFPGTKTHLILINFKIDSKKIIFKTVKFVLTSKKILSKSEFFYCYKKVILLL